MAAEVDPEARTRAIEFLASGCSLSETARRAGYSRMHLSRLMKDQRFAAALEKRRAEIAASPTSPDEELALEVLREIAQDGEQIGIARVAAAKALLVHAATQKKTRRPEAARTPPAPIVLEGGEKAAEAWLKEQA